MDGFQQKKACQILKNGVGFGFDYGDGEGCCEKMFLSTNGKWMKNTLSTVKDEYQDCIKAWQPYYEPNPYVE